MRNRRSPSLLDATPGLVANLRTRGWVSAPMGPKVQLLDRDSGDCLRGADGMTADIFMRLNDEMYLQ
jgi:hypothetical protein